ncbi:MAG TPA: aspartate kinase [Ignavibacteriaceae bacterium]|nr:aspartate kinase [Ignavibacteriaceae bacterium]
MKVIVQKYGGSSVADPEKLKKIAEMVAAVKSEGYGIAVVVSAMGKTTNSLIELSNSVSKDPVRREMDMLLSAGERITMSLLCMALNDLGVEAISLTGSQAGIITNDRHNDARVIEVRPIRVQDEMDKGKVVVVGGFQGVSYKRDVTTLGRGGSDTSAVALAAALNAARCEIYSDVDGVYTADPTLVKEAKHLPEISYQQMQEMSTAGAKVMNSQAIQFAKESGIIIYARSTFKPGSETIIKTTKSGQTKGITSVVHENDVVRVILSYKNQAKDFNDLIKTLEEKQVTIKELNVAEAQSDEINSKASFVVSYKNVYGWENLKERLQERFKENIEFDFNLGALSIIGEGLNRDNETLLTSMSILENINVKVYGISTTSYRLSFLVAGKDLLKGVKAIHKRWIEENV